MSTKSQEPRTPTKKHQARSLREQQERRRMLIIASIVFGLNFNCFNCGCAGSNSI